MFDSLNGVDWKLLHDQKVILIERLNGQSPKPCQMETLWVLVHLLDALQDDACASGRWQFPDSHVQRGGAK